MLAKTRQQIASEYGICTKTLKKWLDNAKVKIPKGLITPRSQELIYKKFGIPDSNEDKQTR